jgi:hypothetical protein
MIYRRVNDETQAEAYEVFAAKTVKAGAPLPNGTVVLESYIQYPGSNQFGKTAYFCTTLERAEIRFDELIARVKANRGETTEDVSDQPTIAQNTTFVARRGRRAVVRPAVVFPSSKSFKMKDLLGLNKDYNQPVLYIAIQKLIKDKKVKVVGTEKNASGRGKPSVCYAVV